MTLDPENNLMQAIMNQVSRTFFASATPFNLKFVAIKVLNQINDNKSVNYT